MKKISILLITIGGILNILGGLFHFAFWQLFNWKESLSVLDQINRNIMLMLNYCLAVLFLLTGIIFIIFRRKITNSMLGRAIMLTMAVVYLVRLALEFVLPQSSLVMGAILLLIVACFLIPSIMPAGNQNGKGKSLQ